ncbi:hypothetical protein [Streptomyces ipomoeae]|uniref:hypothetical protein n=1 Tax=Streptomyces ipomoeae TaxID=103232 RepID=UPI0011479328|nr:hypothetical protein [Streptomyces ipomoeae]MDX2935063.1 hypothetical protein [Streptomyces ipomoeae]TQE14529.1 hypothetical protein SipoB123_46125 [Streptomyces ipomoeae]
MELVLSDDDDSLRLERDMEYLLEDLKRLNVTDLRHLSAGPAPDGTRGGDVVTYTSVILGIAGMPALRSLIGLVQDWLTRRNSGTVELKIGEDELRLTSVSRVEQRRAIDAFVAKVRPEDPDE